MKLWAVPVAGLVAGMALEHDEPFMAHVAPGKTKTILWQFTREGEFHFGCLIPGHFEQGMVGRIRVSPTGDAK